ncbi:uroporphyrinogen-III synthase [Paenarthrobacter nitroguajacolicus]|uniref:uroporphyrinogen-III synthase n=1 Tax=Paenarthrobacter nitroguajacolicus TaxID=211146 RepID=UPI00286535E8|nr:uroporphyrinogen-III synthase [Paenarthrobacter nitroguajacolicus]MDR6989055.1 uroporphyrinogen-III synthase [Paenarthrobacter nitroguajacolicus]
MPRPDLHVPSRLAGRRVLITRSADRARPLAALLHSLGAAPLVLPLIDFERARDQDSLDSALDRLAAGGFDWLVISSITSARVLLEKAAERGTTPAGLVPPATRVAAIGPSSQQVLEAVGLSVHRAPSDRQSAEGLVELWDAGAAQVLLPEADIAAPGLREGLASKGAKVTSVVAYHTVDYPAREEVRLKAELPPAVVLSDDGLTPTLSPDEARSGIGAGTVDAVVAASPSAARRIAQTLLPLGRCRLIAIGRPTAAEASRLGLTVAATANEPTPDGIVAALESVFAYEGNPQ